MKSQQSHQLSSLFKQLGMAHDTAAIENFINDNSVVPDGTEIHELQCWSRSQTNFLQQAITEDAEWCIGVDQLNTVLRQTNEQ